MNVKVEVEFDPISSPSLIGGKDKPNIKLLTIEPYLRHTGLRYYLESLLSNGYGPAYTGMCHTSSSRISNGCLLLEISKAADGGRSEFPMDQSDTVELRDM